MGAVPAMLGNLRYDTIIIANGNDESMTNGVVVRKDSPIAKVKGWNKDYPDLCWAALKPSRARPSWSPP